MYAVEGTLAIALVAQVSRFSYLLSTIREGEPTEENFREQTSRLLLTVLIGYAISLQKRKFKTINVIYLRHINSSLLDRNNVLKLRAQY